MSDLKKKISELPLGTPTDGAVIPYVEGGVTKKALKSDLNGTDGVDGKTILNGSIDPTIEGVDGDFYVNTTSWQIFGPKNTTWGTGVDLIGAIGNGIASIELLSGDHSPGTLDTYRVTYTDTTTFDYQVYNGADGAGDMSKSTYDPANGAKQVAFNDSVVHLTGNETVSGDKTLTGNTSTQSLNITGTNGAGHLHFKHQATDPTATGSSTALFADSNGNLKYKNDGLSYVTFSTNANTANRVYTFPDKTGNVILDTSFGDVINSATEKTTPVDADMVGVMDSAASNVFKKLSWANIKATLKTYFDSLSTILTNKTLALGSNTISGTKAEFNTACTDGNFVYEGATTTSGLTMSTGKLLGRNTASTGAIEEITLGTNLSFSGTTLNATGGGGGVTPIRITILGELIADTAVQQGLYWYNNTGSTVTISNVAFTVSKASAGAGASCAFNIYKSSGTAVDGIDTNAINLFTSAVDLTTNYTSLTNVPNTTTVENNRYVSVRVTNSAGATNKASNAQIIITYT